MKLCYVNFYAIVLSSNVGRLSDTEPHVEEQSYRPRSPEGTMVGKGLLEHSRIGCLWCEYIVPRITLKFAV